MKNICCIENGELSKRKLTSNKRKVFNAEREIKKKKECAVTAICRVE